MFPTPHTQKRVFTEYLTLMKMPETLRVHSTFKKKKIPPNLVDTFKQCFFYIYKNTQPDLFSYFMT